MPFRLIRLVMGRAHGLGISTTCYPSPAPVHGLLSGDNERLKLCPRVQTPAPGLGRLHATVPGICSVQTRSRRTLPDLVVGSTPLHNPAARSVLETAPCRWCSSPTPIWAAESTSHPLHYYAQYHAAGPHAVAPQRAGPVRFTFTWHNTMEDHP